MKYINKSDLKSLIKKDCNSFLALVSSVNLPVKDYYSIQEFNLILSFLKRSENFVLSSNVFESFFTNIIKKKPNLEEEIYNKKKCNAKRV